jgi:predicted nucleic acid-binding protein
MNYLLDTCVISEFIKKQPNDRVVNLISNIPEVFQTFVRLSRR